MKKTVYKLETTWDTYAYLTKRVRIKVMKKNIDHSLVTIKMSEDISGITEVIVHVIFNNQGCYESRICTITPEEIELYVKSNTILSMNSIMKKLENGNYSMNKQKIVVTTDEGEIELKMLQANIDESMIERVRFSEQIQKNSQNCDINFVRQLCTAQFQKNKKSIEKGFNKHFGKVIGRVQQKYQQQINQLNIKLQQQKQKINGFKIDFQKYLISHEEKEENLKQSTNNETQIVDKKSIHDLTKSATIFSEAKEEEPDYQCQKLSSIKQLNKSQYNMIVDLQSAFISKFKINGSFIEFNDECDKKYYQLLGSKTIYEKNENKFTLQYLSKQKLYLGITDRQYINNSSSFYKKNCIAYSVETGKVYVNGQQISETIGVLNKQTVLMVVQGNTIYWKVGNLVYNSYSSRLISNDTIKWVPFIQMYFKGDRIKWQ